MSHVVQAAGSPTNPHRRDACPLPGLNTQALQWLPALGLQVGQQYRWLDKDTPPPLTTFLLFCWLLQCQKFRTRKRTGIPAANISPGSSCLHYMSYTYISDVTNVVGNFFSFFSETLAFCQMITLAVLQFVPTPVTVTFAGHLAMHVNVEKKYE